MFVTRMSRFSQLQARELRISIKSMQSKDPAERITEVGKRFSTMASLKSERLLKELASYAKTLHRVK
jgi:hypothetical protein